MGQMSKATICGIVESIVTKAASMLKYMGKILKVQGVSELPLEKYFFAAHETVLKFSVE